MTPVPATYCPAPSAMRLPHRLHLTGGRWRTSPRLRELVARLMLPSARAASPGGTPHGTRWDRLGACTACRMRQQRRGTRVAWRGDDNGQRAGPPSQPDQAHGSSSVLGLASAWQSGHCECGPQRVWCRGHAGRGFSSCRPDGEGPESCPPLPASPAPVVAVRALRACAGIVPGNLGLTGRRDFPADLLAVAAAAEVVHRPSGLAERRGEPSQLAWSRRGAEPRPVLRRLPLRVAGLDVGQQLRRRCPRSWP